MLQRSLLSLALLLALSTTCTAWSPSSAVVVGGADFESALAMQEILLAYQFDTGISINMSINIFTVNKEWVFERVADFGIVSKSLNATEVANNPTVDMLPFLATPYVPIYRLDALGPNAPPLVFTRLLMWAIWTGNVTHWDDPMMRAANPNATLPHAGIIIIRQDSCYCMNSNWVQAMEAFNPSATPSTTFPGGQLNMSRFYDYRLVGGVTAVAATVVTIDGSMGFDSLAVASTVSVSVGNMYNRAGQVITPSYTSVTAAVVELASQPLPSTTSVANLNDPAGQSAWPVQISSYFIIDRNQTRLNGTCADRAALVSFLYYVYTSSIASTILIKYGYVLFPQLTLAQLKVVERIQTEILCDGRPPSPPAPANTLTIAGSSRLQATANLILELYSRTDTSGLGYAYSAASSTSALSQLLSPTNTAVDAALVFEEGVDAAVWAKLQSNADYLILPLLLVQSVPVFNPRIAASVPNSTASLTIDLTTLTYLLYQQLSGWSDPRLEALNPSLSLLFPSPTPSPNISLVYSCGAETLNAHLYSVLSHYAARHNPALLAFMQSYTGASFFSSFSAPSAANASCTSQVVPRFTFSPSQDSVASVVSAADGAVGIQDGLQGLDMGLGSFAIEGPSGQVSTATLSSTLACAMDTFDPVTLMLDLTSSQQGNCWVSCRHTHTAGAYRSSYTSHLTNFCPCPAVPLHLSQPLSQVAYLVMPRAFADSATNTVGTCTRGKSLLQLVDWLATDVALDSTLQARQIIRPSDLSLIQQAVTDAIMAVTCRYSSGAVNTLLEAQPVVWTVTQGLQGAVIALAALGSIAVVGAVAGVLVYRQETVMRAAAPVFLVISLLGIGLLYVSSILYALTPSASTCAAFNWTANLGFMLAFCPLFAKTWRIWRIFGRQRQLKVVRITNARLLGLITLTVLADVVLLSIWQGVAPMTPSLTTVYSGDPVIAYEYSQCEYGAEGTDFLITAFVTKSVLVAFGALMAFSTRKTSSKFNEAAAIAWSIYNVLFSVGIVFPIILFVSAVGNLRVGLVDFLILWVASFTALVLVAPKLYSVITKQGDDGLRVMVSQNPSTLATTAGGTDDWGFLTASAFTSVPQIQRYMAALEQNLAQVKTRKKELACASANPGSPDGKGTGNVLASARVAASPRSEAGGACRLVAFSGAQEVSERSIVLPSPVTVHVQPAEGATASIP